MRAWPGLEIYIILPGRGSIEEKAAYYDWMDGNEVSNCISFSLCNRTLTPIEESSQSGED